MVLIAMLLKHQCITCQPHVMTGECWHCTGMCLKQWHVPEVAMHNHLHEGSGDEELNTASNDWEGWTEPDTIIIKAMTHGMGIHLVTTI